MSPVLCKARSLGRLGGKAALPAGVALITALSASPEALAQCTSTYNFGAISSNGPLIPQASPLISIINTVNTAFLTNTTSFVSAPPGAQPNQQSGGVWGRTIGGYVDNTADSTSRPDFSKVPVNTIFSPAPPVNFVATGTQECHQTNHQDYAGAQVGADLGTLNLGGSGANLHFGITAGNFYARASDETPGFGDLKGRFEVPFVGAYVAMTQGNFFADGQVRWDFYQSSLSSVEQSFSGVHGDARGISVTGNMGYRIAFMSSWFLEPSVGGVWSQTKIDPIVTPFDVNSGTSTLHISDIDSVLGRATLRLGTNVTQGIYTWQPFVTASAVHEFAGNVSSSVTINTVAPLDPLNHAVFNTTTERFGTYGQFGLGTAIVVGNTGWLGYGRGDVKIGENVQGLGVNLGLRYQW